MEKLKSKFKELFKSEGRIYASPGRVNLIGEHTDYNNGFVLPGAIDKRIYAEISEGEGDMVKVYSLDYNQYLEFSINGPAPAPQWAKYIYGVAAEIQKLGKKVSGFNCVFGGDVPLGAGLSSSAAFESVIGFGLNDIFGLSLSRFELAKVGQMCEHNYVGVRCGIMDQFASLFGEEGKLIKLDCRSLEYELVPFDPKGYKVVLLDTQVKHSLASSEYNVRRAQCEAGVEIIKKYYPKVESLRDVTMDMLNEHKSEMEEAVYRRCSYVICENQRLLDACEALKKGDYKTFGEKMFGSHEGLSKWYEVSCPELDFLADFAKSTQGVLGARMMGGGFGGCTINVVEESAYDKFISEASVKFKEKFGKAPRVIPVVIGQGAQRLA